MTYRTPPPQSDRMWRRQRRAGTASAYNLRDRRCAILRFLRIHSLRGSDQPSSLRFDVARLSNFIHIDTARSLLHFIRVWLSRLYEFGVGALSMCLCACMWPMMTMKMCSNITHFHPGRGKIYLLFAGNCLVPAKSEDASHQPNPIKSIWTQNFLINNLFCSSVRSAAAVSWRRWQSRDSWNGDFWTICKTFLRSECHRNRHTHTGRVRDLTCNLWAHTLRAVEKWHVSQFVRWPVPTDGRNE